jgi:hypothetical protein
MFIKRSILCLFTFICFYISSSTSMLTTNNIKRINKKNNKSKKDLEIEFKGISFIGNKYCPEVPYDSPLALLSLEKLRETGANWVAIVVTEYQDYTNSTEVYPIYENYPKNDYYTYKTETKKGLKKLINHAKNLNLSVLLKPHIDLAKEPNYNTVWRYRKRY